MLDETDVRYGMKQIQSQNHKLGTHKINKISLPWLDDGIKKLLSGYQDIC